MHKHDNVYYTAFWNGRFSGYDTTVSHVKAHTFELLTRVIALLNLIQRRNRSKCIFNSARRALSQGQERV